MSFLPQLLHRYVQYRRVGFGRLAAMRYAWLVVTSHTRPIAPR